MKLEFKVRKLKEGTRSYKNIVERYPGPNQFIIVGEEHYDSMGEDGDRYKVHRLTEDGLRLFGFEKLDEIALSFAKHEFEEINESVYEIVELDIPKKHLTVDILDEVLRLND